jgi:mannosyltransferase OCH1-like enzyme
MPDDQAAYVEGWRRVMPDWTVMAWTDAEIDWSVRYLQQAYATRGWNRISNYMRVRALHEHGGFYLDTDMEMVRPLDPLRGERTVLGFQSVEPGPSWVNGAVIGAEPGSAFTARALRAYHEEMPGWRRMGDAHGPALLTRLLREMGLERYEGAPQRVGEVTLLPVDRFYPYHWTERFTPDCVTPDTFGIHHWEGSWGKHRPLTFPETLRALAAAAAPRLAAAVARRALRREGASRAAASRPRPPAGAAPNRAGVRVGPAEG